MKLFGLFAAFAGVLAAATPTGPGIGTKAPAFELRDQNGATHTLASMLGPKGAILVFYRSADWCPFCKAQLVELENSYAAIRKQGLGLVAVSYDSVEVLKSFADRKKITFPMLSDPGSKTIRNYGIFNETVEKGNMAYGIPFPGTYVLDAKGVIVGKYFEDDYKERETVSSILVQQFGAAAGGVHVTRQSKQLDVSLSASTDAIATGQHVALVLDIDLKPKMHVYAPGVEHYIPIEWQMTESDAAKIETAKWPKSEKLFLQAIDETVPVFKDSFRVVRDIVFAPDAKLKSLVNEKGEITLHGVLKYQACDDRMCFIPASVPLDWTFHYQPLDRERFQKK